jgi:hypothetical protein
LGSTHEFPRSIDILAEFPVVVREIGVGARRAKVRIVRDHPLVMDADALDTDSDELSVEERSLQKPALVFDPLAREAGELGLWTTVSTVLRISGRTSLPSPICGRDSPPPSGW